MITAAWDAIRDQLARIGPAIDETFSQRAAARRYHAAWHSARRRAAVRTDAEQRLATAAQLAGALCDHLPGDAWTLAHAIRRLCNGEITPEQALDATGTD
ncbi:hypothetical protein ACFV5N_23450 [Streptomyces sp. NPDC059853]|uniref:hypothetical protein n=1 Tax=Streptomyces sp. NPDC059853 TaxID=3346973 RepID=UPI00366956ED